MYVSEWFVPRWALKELQIGMDKRDTEFFIRECVPSMLK